MPAHRRRVPGGPHYATVRASSSSVVRPDVAERINKTVRSTDAVARLGGDEFAVVVEDLAGRGDALQIADTLEAVLSEPFVIEQLPIRIGASSGVSLFPDDDETAVGLLNTSDIRMYQAKRKKYETKPGMAPQAKLL